jgi:NADH-quinone oxidoreductase subunit J
VNIAFYVAGVVAVLSTALAISRLDVVHALLYLVVSFLAVATVFVTLGAPFVAALEVIVYAGAIIVLFVFVIMMLNLGPAARDQERAWVRPRTWAIPGILLAVLLAELVLVLATAGHPAAEGRMVGPKEVALVLFGPYVVGVELASLLLLAGLVGAYHLGRRIEEDRR